GVYWFWLFSELTIWKRVRIPSSTLGSITEAMANPWLGTVPSSHARTRSVTSSWYSIGGAAVSLPSSRRTATSGPAGPVSTPNLKFFPPSHDLPTAGSRQVTATSSHATLSGNAHTFVFPALLGSHT